MRLLNAKQTTNTYGQKKIVGDLILKKSRVFRNSKNDGCSPLDPEYDTEQHYTVPRGTLVSYTANSTHNGVYHCVRYTRDDGKKFTDTVFVKEK